MKQIGHPNCVQLFEVIDDALTLTLTLTLIPQNHSYTPFPLTTDPNPNPNPNPQVGARFAGRLLAGRALVAGESDAAAPPAGEAGAARPSRLSEEAEADGEAEAAEEDGEEEASVGYLEAAWVPILAELSEAGLQPKGVQGATPLQQAAAASPVPEAEDAAAEEDAAVGGGVGFIEAAWVPILGELVAAGLRPEGVRGFDVNVTGEGAERQRGATSNKAGAASALEKKSATLPTLDLFGEVRGEGRPLACPPCSRSPRGDVAAEEEPPLTCAAARPHSCTWE